MLSDGAKMPTAHEIQQELIDDTILIMSFERDSMPKRTRFASIGIGRIDGVLKMFLTYLSDTIPNNTLTCEIKQQRRQETHVTLNHIFVA